MGGNEQKFIKEAFDANWVAPLGPNVNGLEQDLESYLGNQAHVGALSSGTSAIHLGLILLGVQAGDEVICQSMTFSASANPILYLGATPVFIDITHKSGEITNSVFLSFSKINWTIRVRVATDSISIRNQTPTMISQYFLDFDVKW